jgi:hypothetical protein
VIFVAVVVLALIVWITGGSFPAIIAGIILLGVVGTFLAARADIVTLPSVVRTLIGLAGAICLIVIILTSVNNWWETSKAQTKPPPPTPATNAVQGPITKGTPERSCTTPCHNFVVAAGKHIWSAGDLPIRVCSVKYPEKCMDLPKDKKNITSENFVAGEQNVTSLTESVPNVLIEITSVQK